MVQGNGNTDCTASRKPDEQADYVSSRRDHAYTKAWETSSSAEFEETSTLK